MNVERIPGFCALCRSRCGCISVVEDGRLVAVEPDPSHPTGASLCVKGRAAPELVYASDRLLHPLRRTSPKGAPDPGWEQISWDENKKLVGTPVEVLVAVGEGRKDGATGRMSGRARDGRLVHFTGTDGVRPGDVVETVVTDAKPHFLVADGALLAHRRTRAGDASEAGTRPSTPGILLGMPRIGAPA